MDSTPEQGTPERFPQRFKPGNPGRKVGTTTKTTRLIREAILIAAELEGQDGKGKGKLIGYMRRMAVEDMKAFAMLLGKVIPLQIENRTLDPRENVTYHSVEEVKRELASRGISMEIALKVMTPDHASVIDDDDLDD